jgi:hypothetical protein
MAVQAASDPLKTFGSASDGVTHNIDRPRFPGPAQSETGRVTWIESRSERQPDSR